MHLQNFDPHSITDMALRHVVLELMNQVETLHAKVQTQAAEIQRLRDENNRLKGEQAKPTIRPNKPVGDAMCQVKPSGKSPHTAANAQRSRHSSSRAMKLSPSIVH